MSKFDLQKLIDNMPTGLERGILTVLRFHQGKDNSILGDDLQKALALHGYHVNERAMRLKIVEMRRDGYLIGGWPGEDGGYYICTTPQELSDFLHHEYYSKINNMRITAQAMELAAEKLWGKYSPARQTTLF